MTTPDTAERIVEELATIAVRLAALDYGLHAAMIRLVADDIREIAAAEVQLFDRPDLVLDILLGKLDAGLAPNGGKNGWSP